MTGARPRLFALVGPTASGKTEASLALAPALGGEIVSIDSTTVYRGMDVSTAKPSPEERAAVRHHLIDVADVEESFSVARFQELAEEALRDVGRRGMRALLVGGSGLYYRAVVDRLAFPGTDPATRTLLELEAAALGAPRLHARLRATDPAAAEKIEPGNARRTVRALEVAAITGRPFSSFSGQWERYPPGRVRAAGIEIAPEHLYPRIEARVRAHLDRGLLEEVRGLAERGLAAAITARQAIGYHEMLEHLEGRISLQEAVARIVRRNKALARRQVAWFRRDPRIRWFRAGPEGAGALVGELGRYFSADREAA